MKAKPGADHRSHLIPHHPGDRFALLRVFRAVLAATSCFRQELSRSADFGRAKAKLDALMRRSLEEQGHTFVPFVLHDIRR